MRRLLPTGAALLAALLLVAGCSASEPKASSGAAEPAKQATTTSTTAPASTAEPFTGDDFYAVPDALPDGPHGTLIRYQAMDDYALDGATTYRIMYTSESLAGDQIAVTGLASVPTAAAPPDGRPMITISHGTTGIADTCAPSMNPQSTEMTLVGAKLAPEFLIAHTDDEGLGTPGRHPYLVGESEGRSAIDAIVAAGQLPDADPGTKLAIAGYSQGGHGAIWASQVAAEWAPDLEVVGTFAGAPASETDIILKAAAHVPGLAGFTYLIVAGFQAAYPDADPSLFLTPKGVELLATVDAGCAPAVFKAVAGIPADELIRPESGSVEPWSTLAEENNAGTEKTNDAPTLIIQSTGDQTVPLIFSETLLGRMCANGQVVERRLIDGGNHGAAAIPAYEQAIPWLQERFEADPPTPVDSCPVPAS